MTIIVASGKKQTILPTKHDLADKKYYSFVYRPNLWQVSKIYFLDQVIIPTVFNGFYYVCKNPGLSGVTQPIFPTSIRGTITDGTVKWEAVAYDMMLNDSDSISTSTWSGTTGITISDISISNGVTSCKVEIIDQTLTQFTLNNHTVLSRGGKTEEFDRSVLVNVAVL